MPLEYEFYIDLFFLKGVFLNLLALMLTAAMGRFKLSVWRAVLMAAAGSAWSVFCLFLPEMPFGAEMFFTVLLPGGFLAAVSFSLKKAGEIGKAFVLFFAAVLVMGGFLFLLKDRFWLSGWEAEAVLGAVVFSLWICFREIFKERERGEERIPVRLFYKGEQRQFFALVDSGNRLREPLSGKPVSVISFGDCKGFCDSVSGVRYIPFQAVGTKSGVLPGIVFERMEFFREGRLYEIEKPIVAVTREPLSGNGDFTMLLPEELILHPPKGKEGRRSFGISRIFGGRWAGMETCRGKNQEE